MLKSEGFTLNDEDVINLSSDCKNIILTLTFLVTPCSVKSPSASKNTLPELSFAASKFSTFPLKVAFGNLSLST